MGVKDQGRYVTRLVARHLHSHPPAGLVLAVSAEEEGLLERPTAGFRGLCSAGARKGRWWSSTALGISPSLDTQSPVESSEEYPWENGDLQTEKLLVPLVNSGCDRDRSPADPHVWLSLSWEWGGSEGAP